MFAVARAHLPYDVATHHSDEWDAWHSCPLTDHIEILETGERLAQFLASEECENHVTDGEPETTLVAGVAGERRRRRHVDHFDLPFETFKPLCELGDDSLNHAVLRASKRFGVRHANVKTNGYRADCGNAAWHCSQTSRRSSAAAVKPILSLRFTAAAATDTLSVNFADQLFHALDLARSMSSEVVPPNATEWADSVSLAVICFTRAQS